ncbi:TetR/AcrR family transcriptional regulator [Herbiconiux sp. L3-i23]|uniref:TetR/AcrR family transcriptional regulator n=1 Tax=Herbiconiux sp. L3-i23 TaxID=2905871 RepID=UPI002045CD8B|nr:TetR/AcrR family transcriptional regulator [Herbiconiux sp. L3-i23]BDI24092.1 hypothetical protein L3i23_28680 [Herbiconiux sp. L3-i23]
MPASSPPRPLRRDAAANRDALLLAARRVLAADPEAPLEAIVADASLTRRAFYGHFPSRDALLVELARRGASRVADAVRDVERDDTRLTIALLAARLWREVADVRVLTQRTLHGPLAAEIAEPLAPVRALLVRTVERGIANGELRRDIPAETLARLLESAALAVLDEAATTGMASDDARTLAMRSTLSTAGLSWAEAASLLETTPELQEDA